MNLPQKINRFLHNQRLLERGDAVVAAVSGGVDSVTMLDILLALRGRHQLKIAVAHVNHGLRGEESDADEEFVRNFAAERGIECRVGRVDTRAEAELRKLSIQETARELRYEFFSRVRRTLGFTKIATGHNADDNAETVLLNLFRGSGVRGLAGIPPVREDLKVVRPLLAVTRLEIEGYAREHNLSYRTDSSNLTDDYTRNYLRHSVVPILREKVNPAVVEVLGRTAGLFRELDKMLRQEAARLQESVVERRSGDEMVLNIGKLQTLPVFMQEYSVWLAARDFLSHELDHTAAKSLAGLIEAETGSMVHLAQRGAAFRDRDRIVFRSEVQKPFRFEVEPNRSYQFDRFSFSSADADTPQYMAGGAVEYVNAGRLGKSLVLRSWSDGDWFYPLGMQGKKKLSDFFIDVKVPLYEKRSIPVLESDGAIVWVCGKRIDDRFKVIKGTRRILRLEYSPRTVA